MVVIWMKVLLLGASGSGKSTLAKKLGSNHKIEVTHIDMIYWKDNWVSEERDLVLDKINHVLSKKEWIIDGNYSNYYFDRRCNDADHIIFLNFNRFQSLFWVFRRYFMYKGKSRDDIGEGCIEKIDFQFIKYVLLDYPKKKKVVLPKLKHLYGDKLIILKNRRQMKEFKL